MHTLNRIITSVMMMALGMPALSFALVSIDEREEAKEVLEESINSAVGSYQARSGIQSQKQKNEAKVRLVEEKIPALNRKKFESRKEVAKYKRIISSISQRYGIALEDVEQVETMITVETRRLLRIVKSSYLTGAPFAVSTTDSIVKRVFHASAPYNDTLAKETYTQFMKDLFAAKKAFTRLEEAEKNHAEVLEQYWAVEKELQDAKKAVQSSEERLEQIKATVEEVHQQVLRMQGQLARIDAKLKEKAERALLEKGLITKEELGKDNGKLFAPQFSWPVFGRVSSGFKNVSYRQFFGVDHYGQDIVVPQGTVVRSAAEGVVFLSRDGGKTGYSYILVGHRGGYATLYGHVSEAYVVAGQEVSAGQAIGLSGGTPGTHGAGPMTTGAHLHFEVIKNGVNVDPAGVLP